MARTKTTEQIEREQRAQMWQEFRRENLFTQKRLAQLLHISRRTVQQIEAAKVSPHQDTLRVFVQLKRRYDANREFETKETQWLKAIT